MKFDPTPTSEANDVGQEHSLLGLFSVTFGSTKVRRLERLHRVARDEERMRRIRFLLNLEVSGLSH
jgi:hypothetical protein